MGIEDTVKQNSTIIVWVANIIIGLYVYGQGKILSYDTSEIVVYAAIGASLWVYNMMHKDLLKEISKTPEVKEVKQPQYGVPPQQGYHPPPPYHPQPNQDKTQPFDLDVNQYGRQ